MTFENNDKYFMNTYKVCLTLYLQISNTFAGSTNDRRRWELLFIYPFLC